MNFDFYSPVRMFTGEGCVIKNKQQFATLGTNCLIVTSKTAAKKSGALDDVIHALGTIPYTLYGEVKQNPSLLGCYEAGQLAKDCGADFIIGIGGGSPLDAAKAIAVFATNDIDNPMDIYKMDWKSPALPMALIGTTAGTGSEVGPASVLTTPDGRKQSISHEQLYPTIAFGDANYTRSLPLSFTVSTALDALSHAVEGYFSLAANDMSDIYALSAMELLSKDLKELQIMKTEHRTEISFAMRETLYFASVLAGMTLAKCGTSYCHRLGYYLTEEKGFAHGTACAVFLPDFLRRGAKHAPQKADQLIKRTGQSIDTLCNLVESLNEYPRLNLEKDSIDDIAARGIGSSNYKRALPNGFSKEEASELLTQLFG